jgi:hypothetical protein
MISSVGMIVGTSTSVASGSTAGVSSAGAVPPQAASKRMAVIKVIIREIRRMVYPFAIKNCRTIFQIVDGPQPSGNFRAIVKYSLPDLQELTVGNKVGKRNVSGYRKKI